MAHGRSIDTTMGFTPTAGLVMGTRSGDLDPAVPLWLVEHAGLDLHEVAEGLDHESGLRGLAGVTDMREVVAAEAAGDPDAALAVEIWLHRLCAGVAAMTAALGGLDALVFNGGIGENAAGLRSRAVGRLAFLGLGLDEAANRAARVLVEGDADVSAFGARVRTLMVHTREDLVIARAVREMLTTEPAGAALPT